MNSLKATQALLRDMKSANRFHRTEGKCEKICFLVLGPFRMALFPELWDAGNHNLCNLA